MASKRKHHAFQENFKLGKVKDNYMLSIGYQQTNVKTKHN